MGRHFRGGQAPGFQTVPAWRIARILSLILQKQLNKMCFWWYFTGESTHAFASSDFQEFPVSRNMTLCYQNSLHGLKAWKWLILWACTLRDALFTDKMANIQLLLTHLTSFEIDIPLILPACKKNSIILNSINRGTRKSWIFLSPRPRCFLLSRCGEKVRLRARGDANMFQAISPKWETWQFKKRTEQEIG